MAASGSPLKRPASTISASAGKQLEFFGAWFCPYAQRAWIALEHHRLPYENIEALLPDSEDPNLWKGYVRHPRLLELNPRGLVPTISEGPGSPAVYESLVCVEYVDEVAAGLNGGSDARPKSLLPGGPAQRAEMRIQADWVNRRCCSPMYQILVRKEPDLRLAGLADLKSALGELDGMIATSGGPYIAGSQLTAVDIAFIPHAYRILVCRYIERFRGEAFAIDMGGWPALSKWVDTVFALEQVKATLIEPERLAGAYKRYADGTANSKVADAVRDGKAADTV